MPREWLILSPGRRERGPWEALCADYRRRIARFVPVRDLAVKASGAGGGRERRRAEGEALLAAVPPRSFPIALDRQGEALSSEKLAARMARLRRDWPHPVAFLLGSDLGLDPEVAARARLRLSLGPLTLPHELARLVLYEQLYRGLCIEAGINYHRRPL